jgi:hypothetical protein
MLEFTLRVSGNHDSEDFQSTVEEIRKFVMKSLSETEFSDLDMRKTLGTPYSRPFYGGYTPYAPRPVFRSSVIPDSPSTEENVQQDSTHEYLLNSRGSVDALVRALNNLVETYSVFTIADVKELLGLSSQDTDSLWGWSSVEALEIKQTRAGWQVIFPEATEVVK